MAQEWFYTKDGKCKLGPVSPGELQALAKSGQLLPADMVWKQGMSQWTAANAVKGLFTNLKSTPKSAAAPVARSVPPASPATPAGANLCAEGQAIPVAVENNASPPPMAHFDANDRPHMGGSGRARRTPKIIGVAVGGSALVLFALILLFAFGKRIATKNGDFSSGGLELSTSNIEENSYGKSVVFNATIKGKIPAEERFLVILTDTKGNSTRVQDLTREDLIVNGHRDFRVAIDGPVPGKYVLTVKSFKDEHVVCKKTVILGNGKISIENVDLGFNTDQWVTNNGTIVTRYHLQSINISVRNTGEIPVSVSGGSFHFHGKQVECNCSFVGGEPTFVGKGLSSVSLYPGDFREEGNWPGIHFNTGDVAELSKGKLYFTFCNGERQALEWSKKWTAN